MDHGSICCGRVSVIIIHASSFVYSGSCSQQHTQFREFPLVSPLTYRSHHSQLVNQRQIIVNQFGFSPLITTLLGCVDGVVESASFPPAPISHHPWRHMLRNGFQLPVRVFLLPFPMLLFPFGDPLTPSASYYVDLRGRRM